MGGGEALQAALCRSPGVVRVCTYPCVRVWVFTGLDTCVLLRTQIWEGQESKKGARSHLSPFHRWGKLRQKQVASLETKGPMAPHAKGLAFSATPLPPSPPGAWPAYR